MIKIAPKNIQKVGKNFKINAKNVSTNFQELLSFALRVHKSGVWRQNGGENNPIKLFLPEYISMGQSREALLKGNHLYSSPPHYTNLFGKKVNIFYIVKRS
jgi:hypothetical protein